MNTIEWAKREVELYKKQSEEADKKDPDYDPECPLNGYVTACLNSAMKALISLMSDGHSGMSIGIARGFLDRLVQFKPLTPLTGDDSEWSICNYQEKDCTRYQNIRYSSLFKYVFPDGTIKYSDCDRFTCVDIRNDAMSSWGRAKKIADEYVPPISMPYTPSDKPIKIFYEDFLSDPKNGDFDTVGILYLEKPDGEIIDVKRYMTEVEGEMQQCTEEVYKEKRAMHELREGNMIHSAIESSLSRAQKVINKLDDPGKLSDGYHTFDELYHHRTVLFSIICNSYPMTAWKSWKHHPDSDPMYEDMFIAGVTTPTGDYSYHCEKEYWDKFNVKELPNAPLWDGHVPKDIDRLEGLVNES